MPTIHMRIEGGRSHLVFWCNLYSPRKFYYPKENYTKGEKICRGCCKVGGNIIYRAPFQCERIATPSHLSRFCIHKGDPAFYRSHPMDIPAKEAQHFKDLFGWLNAGEIETKRRTQTKTLKKSTERKDIHGATGGASTGFLQDNPERTELKKPEETAGEQTIEQGDRECGGSSSEGRLQGLPGSPVPISEPVSVLPPVNNSKMRWVRSESEIADNQRCAVEPVPGLQEQTDMKEEFDESYEQTTAHSCITCKCGTKVWYGCGVKQLTRPKYCKACEKKERARITASYSGKVDNAELQRILDWELRRGINR